MTPARRFLAVAAVGAIVLAGVLYLATTLDARPPTVTAYRLSQALAGSETTALTTTSLEVLFSEPVDTESAERAFEIEPAVEGSISWSGATMLFTPAERLPLETEFEVRVGPGVVDQHGNETREAAQPFAFVTVGRPMVVESEPADGAREVPVDAPIAISFSTLMDTASVEAALEIEPSTPHELRWSQERLEILPSEPFEAGRRYELRIGPDAADLTGTPLDEAYVLGFETVASRLEPAIVVPTDGSEGIAVISPIALVFDRELDPDSVDAELLRITPETAGSLEVLAPDGSRGMLDAEASILRFQPSAPLPPNTTFEIVLAPGVTAADGSQLAVPLRWTFTTGAPQPTIGNQVVFLSDRSGVTNLWSMNPDGTNQRQLSAELSEIVDYAVSPDARTIVVGDGAQLVQLQADGGDRRLLTEEGLLEFDPAFSPDGRRLAFGRADAATGAGRGLWQRAESGGEAEAIVLPPEVGASPGTPTPTATATEGEARLLRAPRYSPDGSAMAFVDAAGHIGIVELPGARLTTVPFRAAAPPAWLPDSSAVLLSGREAEETEVAPTTEGPLLPLDPASVDLPQGELGLLELVSLSRSGSSLERVSLGFGISRCVVDATGSVACIRFTRAGPHGGVAVVAESPRGPADALAVEPEMLVSTLAFTPEVGTMLLARVVNANATDSGGIWRVDQASGEAEQLASDGRAPAWLP